jgi:small subunit ribosomal protein S8
MVADPIADMLVRIRNAGKAGQEIAVIPYSNIKFEISNILLKRGFIKGFSVKGKKVNKRIEVEILYTIDKMPRVENGMAILSTPQGILSGDDARKLGVGGEILFNIW